MTENPHLEPDRSGAGPITMRLLSMIAVAVGLCGCAVVGEVRTTTVTVDEAGAEVTTRGARGAITCAPPLPGAAPCRAGAP